MEIIELNIPSELYGRTIAVIDSRTRKNGLCNCGDGSYYKLTPHEFNQLSDQITQETFIPSNDLAYPRNLISKLSISSDHRLELPKDIQFTSKEYTDLKREVIKAGGLYKKNGFVFKEPALDVYHRIISGDDYNIKKKFQFFATPDVICDLLVSLAEISTSDNILEPSAGDGSIIRAINRALPNKNISCFELMPINRESLKTLSTANLIGDDFLTYSNLPITQFDKIIANPPFSKNQDIDHIYKMYSSLKENGRIVTIASRHWLSSNNKKESQFRDWLQEIGATTHDVPQGAFKESGTNIQTIIIVINKSSQPTSNSTNKKVNSPTQINVDLDEVESDIDNLLTVLTTSDEQTSNVKGCQLSLF